MHEAAHRGEPVDKWRSTPLFGGAGSGFHPPWRRGFTHPTIGVSPTESRGFTHRLFQQAVELTRTKPLGDGLNLLNESYLIELLNPQTQKSARVYTREGRGTAESAYRPMRLWKVAGFACEEHAAPEANYRHRSTKPSRGNGFPGSHAELAALHLDRQCSADRSHDAISGP